MEDCIFCFRERFNFFSRLFKMKITKTKTTKTKTTKAELLQPQDRRRPLQNLKLLGATVGDILNGYTPGMEIFRLARVAHRR
jgi:hypothetical protein